MRLQGHRATVYGVAVAAVVATACIRSALSPWIAQEAPLLPFLLPVAFAAYFGGRGPATLALVTSAVTAHLLYRVLPDLPYDHIAWRLHLALFIAVAAGCSEIVHRLQHTRLALSASIEALRSTQRQALADEVRFVTERKDAEESRGRLAAIVESAYEGIVSCTIDGMVTTWNQGAVRIFGYSAAEMVGTSIERLVPPDQSALAEELFTRIRSRQSGTSIEAKALTREGRPIHILIGFAPIANAAGDILAAAFTVHDISDRKRAEDGLRESEMRLRSILDRAPAVVFLKDRQGRYQFVNEEFLRIFSMQREAVLGRDEEQLFPPDTAAQLRVHAQRVWSSGTPLTTEETVQQEGGLHTYVATKFLLRDLEGQPYTLCGISTDITSQKHIEEALRAADRTKDVFLATLSHELRNPLAPIRQAAHLLQVPNLDPLDAQRSRRIIERQALHMSRLLDDLLDISRITRGTLELRTERLDICAGIEAALEIARPLIEARRHTLTKEVSQEPLYVNADPVRLAQISANLLTNAAKYTPEGGVVGIQIREEGAWAILRVFDNGLGIAEDVLPRIFEMFSQGKTEREHAQGGLGIGLALVRGLVQLHGGSIEAHSEGTGQGSEFVVRIPLAPAIAQPALPQVRATRAISKTDPLLILIADDNRDAADSLRLLLQLDGHRVHVIYDGQAALEAAETLQPDVALLDIGMPFLTGIEVAERIRTAPWGAHMTLIAITGWGQTRDKERTAAAGFNHHVTKPIDPQVLSELIASLPRPDGYTFCNRLAKDTP